MEMYKCVRPQPQMLTTLLYTLCFSHHMKFIIYRQQDPQLGEHLLLFLQVDREGYWGDDTNSAIVAGAKHLNIRL